MYKSLNNIAPNYLQNKFTFTHSIHNLNLRSCASNLLYVPKPHREIFRKSLAYSGSRIWNTLPDTVRQAKNLETFKNLYLKWKRSI